MSKGTGLFCLLLLHVFWSAEGWAFRNCETENSQSYAATTRYVVGEIDFDDITGVASGTETIYNYANQDSYGFSECHVTYELSGSYIAGSETFTLDAQRTNHSVACPQGFLEQQYPASLMYSLQMEFHADGSSRVNAADSGEVLASGTWGPGRTAYKTPETCTIF